MFNDWNALPDNVTRQIFSHLDFDDLFLNASLVCRDWYDYIGRSTKCMDKVRLKIEGWHDLDIISESLAQSPRLYNSLMFYNLNAEKKFPYLLLRRWKDVKLIQMKFINPYSFFHYIKEFGGELESLDVERIVIIQSNECEEKLELPKLKHLTLKQVPTSAFQVFDHYSNMKSLHFDIPAFGSKRRMDITHFFANFRNVKMEKLVICRNSLYGLPIETHRIMESVIISMKDSLQEIELRNWGFCHTLEEIFNHLKTSNLSINVCSHTPLTQNLLNLNPNYYLKRFELSMLSIPEVEWFKRFFMLTPHLEDLSISLVRKEVVYLAAHYLRKLKSLSYKSCIIEVASENNVQEEDSDDEEEENNDPGSKYNFIGPQEVFEISKFSERASVVKRYSDERLGVNFAFVYYSQLKSREPTINQHIKIHKFSSEN